MYQDFLTHVNQNFPDLKSEKTLLAVSGGLDSVVMTHLFLKIGVTFGIAHCNFKLRGSDSDEDEAFVKQLADDNGITIHVRSFDTETHASQNGISIQMAARELRYNFFNELLKETYSRLAIAHHKDDQFETVLFNLIKGTGIRGLTGWEPENNHIYRPLLFATKTDIASFAEEHKIKWREDSSNERTDYLRNKIRHHLIPTIKEINPNYLETYEGTKIRLKENTKLQFEHQEMFKNKAVLFDGTHITIDKKTLVGDSASLLVLQYILPEYGFNFTQCQEILKSIEHVGITFRSASYILNVDRDQIIISPEFETKEPMTLDDISLHVLKSGDSLSMETLPNHSSIDLKTTDKFTGMLDKGKLTFPLKLRAPRDGDSFSPLGLKGKKKVSDFMIDAKIPVNLKSRVQVLESSNNIVWIIGHRIDDRYKVTPDTKEILRLTYTHAS